MATSTLDFSYIERQQDVEPLEKAVPMNLVQMMCGSRERNRSTSFATKAKRVRHHLSIFAADRIFRFRLDIEKLLDLLKSKKKRVIFAQEPIDNTFLVFTCPKTPSWIQNVIIFTGSTERKHRTKIMLIINSNLRPITTIHHHLEVGYFSYIRF